MQFAAETLHDVDEIFLRIVAARAVIYGMTSPKEQVKLP
jgi:hypothetical protein